MDVFLGFCKAGIDIRLAKFESDCTTMVPYSPEYILFALQPMLGRGDNLVVVAINLKSLPPPTSSSQGDYMFHVLVELYDVTCNVAKCFTILYIKSRRISCCSEYLSLLSEMWIERLLNAQISLKVQ